MPINHRRSFTGGRLVGAGERPTPTYFRLQNNQRYLINTFLQPRDARRARREQEDGFDCRDMFPARHVFPRSGPCYVITDRDLSLCACACVQKAYTIIISRNTKRTAHQSHEYHRSIMSILHFLCLFPFSIVRILSRQNHTRAPRASPLRKILTGSCVPHCA